MTVPEKLRPGDTVGLIAPSSPVTPERLHACIEAVRRMGYRVKTAGNITESVGGYMAGSAVSRAQAVNRMFADKEVRAIFCIRGGDGGTRVAPLIDLDLVRANPKIFVGYSDITSFHLLFNQKCGLVTFHGPMVSSNMVDAFDGDTRSSFFECINCDGEYRFRNPAGEPIRILKPGAATAPVIGGNLSLLAAAMGTGYEPDTSGKILFIEEVDEPVVKIEKWMCQLLNAGKLSGCAGILLGQFTGIVNREMPDYTELSCIRELLAEVRCPVMYNLQSGHGEKIMTVPLGAVCTMDTEARKLVFDLSR